MSSMSGEIIITIYQSRYHLHKDTTYASPIRNVRNLKIRRHIPKLAFPTEMQSSAFKACQASIRLINKSSSILARTTPVFRTTTATGNFILQRTFFSTSKMSLNNPNSDIPKNEMVYFPNMTTSLPSESAEFRRVLFTGLYSQLVLMTVPVGGDIGDEVGQISSAFRRVENV